MHQRTQFVYFLTSEQAPKAQYNYCLSHKLNSDMLFTAVRTNNFDMAYPIINKCTNIQTENSHDGNER